MRASPRLRGLLLCLLFVVCLASHAKVAAQVKASQPAATITVPVEADGTVDLPAEAVPMSKFLSLEGKAYLNQHLHDMQDPSQTYMEKGIPRFMVPYFERQKMLFAVHRSTFYYAPGALSRPLLCMLLWPILVENISWRLAVDQDGARGRVVCHLSFPLHTASYAQVVGIAVCARVWTCSKATECGWLALRSRVRARVDDPVSSDLLRENDVLWEIV